MLHSLRLRLLLTMLAVVAVTAGTVALLAQQTTMSEFQRFLQLSDERSQSIATLLVGAEGMRQQSEAERQTAVTAIANEVGDRVILADERGTIIADSSGELLGQPASAAPQQGVLFISLDVATGQAFDEAGVAMPWRSTVLFDTEAMSNTLAVTDTNVIIYGAAPFDVASSIAPAPDSPQAVQIAAAPVMVRWDGFNGPDPVQAGFVAGVNRSLAMALLAAGATALLLTAALSRRIIGPVEELRVAAEQMALGDLSRRVRVRSHDELAALGRSFNTMAGALQHGEELRRTMVSDVAHELRTPLTNIRGYLEAMRDGVVTPDARTLDSLHDEALLLNRLVDDLQDLALAEAGQLTLHRRPTDLSALAEHALAAIRPRMAAKGVTCALDAPAALPYGAVDAERIGQVLRNLLENALTHTPAGGQVTVALALAQDDDAAERIAQPALCVTVSDTGGGIAPADLPLIFERFYRADRSRSRATGGSGLGLTIVRRLVEAHDGRVWVTSAPGQGTRLSFTVPVADAPEAAC